MAKYLNYWWNGQKIWWIYANKVWEQALDFEYPGGLESQYLCFAPTSVRVKQCGDYDKEGGLF